MPFKGTNRDAYKKARKFGKTPKERSEIYYKSKNKIESKPSSFSGLKDALFGGSKDRTTANYAKVNPRTITPTVYKPKQYMEKYVHQRIILDDIRDYRSSKIVSNISNFLATAFVRITCNNMTNDQMNFFRSTIALVASEAFNKSIEKPVNVMDNIKMFIKVSKVVYKVVMYFDEKANEYRVNDSKTIAVKNNDEEYLLFLKQHPKVKTIEKIAEIIDYLGKEVLVKVDRKLGSVHPNHPDIIYPINYGFLPNTVALDGEEQDAYILGINEPIDEFKGIVKAVIIRKNDNENKLVVCSVDYNLTKFEIIERTNFQEQLFETEIIM